MAKHVSERVVKVVVSGQEKIDQLTRALESADEEIDRLETSLAEAKDRIQSLQDTVANAKWNSGVGAMEEELRRFKQTASQSYSEFQAFLESAKLVDGYAPDDERFSSLFRKIKDGSMTASQAIAKVKTDFAYLMEENYGKSGGVFDSQIVQSFSATLDRLAQSMDVVIEKINYIENNGIKSSGGGGAGFSTGIADISTMMTQIMESAKAMSDTATGSVDSISNLVGALGRYASIDGTKLLSVSQAFRNMADLHSGSFSTKSVENLVLLMERLKKVNESGVTRLRFDFQGLKDFKVSKTIGHLTDFMNNISESQISMLERLQSIDLSNFNGANFKIDSASIKSLKELFTILNTTGFDAKSIAATSVSDTAIRLAQEAQSVQSAMSSISSQTITSSQGATQSLSAEQAQLVALNNGFAAHVQMENDAANAENMKAMVSQLLAILLEREAAAMDNASASAAAHASTIIEDTSLMQGSAAAYEQHAQSLLAASNAEQNIITAAQQRAQALLNAAAAVRESANADTAAAAAAGEFESRLLSLIQAQQMGAVSATQFASVVQALYGAYAQAGAATQQYYPALAAANSAEESSAASARSYRDAIIASAQAKQTNAAAARVMAAAIEGEFRDVDASATAHQNAAQALQQQAQAEQSAAQAASSASGATAQATASQRQYYDALTQVNNILRNVQNAKHTLETTPGGTSRAEYAELTALEQRLQSLQSAGSATPFQALKDAIAEIRNGLSGALQSMNLFTTATKDAEAANKEMSTGIANRDSGLRDLNNLLVQCTNAEKRFVLAGQLPKMKGSYGELKQVTQEVKNLIPEFERASTASDSMMSKVAALKTRFTQAMSTLKTGGLFSNYFSNGMNQLASRLSYTFGLANLVYRAVAGVKKMVSTAVELNTAMNNLQIVTRGTNEEMAAYTDRVTAMAMETAQSTKDLIDATTVYARLGYDMDESAVLAKYTAMLQGVGDIEAQAAQDAITAIVKAFDVKVSDVEGIMDKLVTVGNNFPISVSQIAEGMNNASSMLAVAGNSFEESVALLTAANTTIQNVSKASTGLRTIAARIRKTTTGLDDDGEIVEESKYQDMIDALSKHKVSLVDINGEYRKTYDIIKDISHVWDQMTSMEQAAVIEAMAGTRQQNIFTSLVTQFKEAENAMAAMSDSAGALEESYDIRMSSIQAHVNQLKVAFDQLSMDFVQSDFAKGLVDGLTKIVLAIDKVVEKAGVLGTVFGTIAAVELLRNLPAIGTLILGLIAPMVTLGEAAAVATGSLVGLSGALASVSAALGPIALVAAAIGAAFLIFNAIAKESSNSIESLRDEATKAERNVNDLAGKIDLNNQRIKELNDLKTDGSISDAQSKELAILEQENQKLAEQLELRKQIAKYTAGLLADAEEEENRARAQRFFDTGRTEDVYLDRGNNGRYVTQRTTTGFGGVLNAIDDFNEAEQNLIEANNKLSEALTNAEKEGVELPKTEYDSLTADVKSAQERLAAETNVLRELKIDLMEEADATGLTIGQQAGYQAMIGKLGRALGETDTSYDRMMLRDLSESQIDALRNVKSFDEFDDLFQSNEEIEKHVRVVVDENELKSISEEEAFYFNIDRDALAKEMQSLTEGGNTDLLMRPVIDTSVLKEKGFTKEVEQAGEGAATLFSQTFSNAAGDYALFTPMYLDENGNTQVLTAEEFGNYCSEVMEGVKEDDLKLKITADFTGDNAKAEAEALALRLSDLQGIYYQAEIEALNKSGTAAQKAALEHEFLSKTIEGIQTSIKSLESYASEAMSDSGLSFESVDKMTKMFKDLEGFDAKEFFDITSTGIRVNSEELGNLTKQYYELEKKKITDKIRSLRDEAETLRDKLSGLTDSEEDVAEKQNLIAQSDALEKQISEAEMAAAAIDGMTNAYMNYLRALNTPNQNENYLNIAKGFETIEGMINAGWVGNDEVTAFLDYIYADRTGVLKDNETAWKNLFKTIGKSGYSIKDFYTTDSSEGVYNFLDTVDSIFSGYVSKGKDGKYSFDFEGDRLFEIQDKLNLSVEAMQDMERAMESANFTVDFSTLTDDVARASYELKKMGKIKFSLNDVLTGGADVNEAIDSVLTRLKEFQDPETGQINLSAEGAQEAYDILMRLIEVRDQLDGKDASVDVEANADSANKDLDDLRNKIDELDNLNKQIEIQTALGNDPKDLKDQVREILDELSNNEIAQKLKVDTTSGKSAVESFNNAVENKELVESLTVDTQEVGDGTSVDVEADVDVKGGEAVEQAVPDNLTTEVTYNPITAANDEARAHAEDPVETQVIYTPNVPASVDATRVETSQPETKEIDFVPDTGEYDGVIASVLATEAKTVSINLDASAYYGAIGSILAVASKTVVITTHLFTIDHGTIGGGGGGGGGGGRYHTSAQGTAHAGGTAMKKGYWGAKKDEEALVGEVGPELRVRDGRWELIGEDSAEIADIRKGDIIFNAEQTRQILKNGKIVNGKKRGISYLFGTAYDRGSGGRRPVVNPRRYGPTAYGGQGGGKTDNDGEGSKIDWIEVLLDRLGRVIDNFEKIASSGLKNISVRLNATADEIEAAQSKLHYLHPAYERYIEEAKNVDLDDTTKAMVRSGGLNIWEYDEETRGKISEYQTWYEKALAVQDAMEDLHQTIGELYISKFSTAQQYFENQLSRIEHAANMVQKNMDMAEKRGYLESATFYEQLAENEQQYIDKLKVELGDLNVYFKQAMNSHEIAEGSEAWNEMKGAIEAVEESIADANIQLLEYQRTLRKLQWDYFDYAQERFGQIQKEAQFLIDVMSNDQLFGTDGKFTDLGDATAAMHAVIYDAYMLQADEYAKEIQKIQNELVNDPADTELIARREELLGLQQEAIMAAEDEKDAVKNLVEEGIGKQIEALEDLINKYKDSLDSAKDLYEYQKKVTEKTADIASIQKQLSAYTNDTSEETRAKVQKLQKDLTDAQKELTEIEWDQNIADQKKLLDELFDDYSDLMNARLDDVDLLMREIIESSNENMARIDTTIREVGNEVGYTVTERMNAILQGDFANYDHAFEGTSSVAGVLENIYSMVAAMARASGAVKAYATGGLVDYTGLAVVHGSKGKPELMLNASDTEKFLSAAQLMRDAQMSQITTARLSGLNSSAAGVNIGQISLGIQIDHVQDYNDLITQMRNDPKFERLISAMTLDRAVGKSSFGKNRIVF